MDLQEMIKKTLLAGIGAAAVTVEKSQEIVDLLAEKGAQTVQRGKEINEELKHSAEAKKAENDEETPDLAETIKDLTAEELAKLKALLDSFDQKSE